MSYLQQNVYKTKEPNEIELQEISEFVRKIYDADVSHHYENPNFMITDEATREYCYEIYKLSKQSYSKPTDVKMQSCNECEFHLNYGSACVALMTGVKIVMYDPSSGLKKSLTEEKIQEHQIFLLLLNC